jgi:hypothetical protein
MRWVHVFHVVDPLIPGISYSYIQSEEGHCELFVIAAADFSVVGPFGSRGFSDHHDGPEQSRPIWPSPQVYCSYTVREPTMSYSPAYDSATLLPIYGRDGEFYNVKQ